MKIFRLCRTFASYRPFKYRMFISDFWKILFLIEENKAASPLGKIGTPKDAANAIYLMCVPESDWITGEIIVASGGVRS